MSDPLTYTVVATDVVGLTLGEHASVSKRSNERVVGFSESPRADLQSAADLVDGSTQASLIGVPPSGESDTLVAGAILVSRLNADGGTWSNLELAEEPADCAATDRQVPGRFLRLQVVRACSSQHLWYELASVGSSVSISSVQDLVRQLRESINRKARRYATADQNDLILVLDANRLPAFILSDVRDAAIEQLGPMCAETGFAAIWVVGPTPETSYALFVRRVDEPR